MAGEQARVAEHPRLSIVSGTYNRLRHLKKMVDSVRRSVGKLTYEIILVDGGSTDGTIEWCVSQKDVVLIAQGQLVGAIKAFNAGCARARGDYVVILNDDIEVVGNTILRSHDYMEKHPECGQVAYRNRTTDSAAAPRAAYSHSYGFLYGQCCITRRWIGEAAGWWGKNEGLHTYGGDSRLGMRIWELGYCVDQMDGCEILDHVVLDQMRRDRTAMLRPNPRGPHRDTEAYRRIWDGRMPRVEAWIPAPPVKLMWKAARGQLRSLRFRHNRPGTKMVRTTQLDAFKRLGPSKHVDHTTLVADHGIKKFQVVAENIIDDFKPDLVMFQAHGAGNIQPETVESMRDRWPYMIFTNFDGDFHNPLRDFHFKIARAVHLQMVISPDLFPRYRNHKAPNVAWWYPAYEDVFRKAGDRRPPYEALDGPNIVCLMNRTPPEVFPEAHTRIEATVALAKSNLGFEIYGMHWDKHGVQAAGVTYNNDGASADLYRRARMTLSISQSKDLYGYTSNRAFFAGAVGIPQLMQQFNGMEDIGFVDGETVIAWRNLDEMFNKARYWLKRPRDLEEIGQRCRRMVLSRHSYDVRLEQLLVLLDETMLL